MCMCVHVHACVCVCVVGCSCVLHGVSNARVLRTSLLAHELCMRRGCVVACVHVCEGLRKERVDAAILQC